MPSRVVGPADESAVVPKDYPARVRRMLLLLAVLALTACGSKSTSTTVATTTATPPPPGPGKVLYAGGDWAVVVNDGKAAAYHRVGGAWQADRSGRVQVRVLGPKPGTKAAKIPQVAVELSATKPLVESALWIDGEELLAKGGGLTPTKGTIYGAPAAPLAKGEHTAVGYGRTGTSGTAVAWTFRV